MTRVHTTQTKGPQSQKDLGVKNQKKVIEIAEAALLGLSNQCYLGIL